MSRYVNADELIKELDKDGIMEYGYRSVFGIPIVDAAEVVRCKDCRFNPKVSVVGCPMAGIDKRKDLDFCSYGEKVTE